MAKFRARREMDARALACAIAGSKAGAQRLLAGGALRGEEGAPLRATDRVREDERILLALARGEALAPANEMPATVLYEDAFLLAAEKPAGILVHGDGTGADTLTERVRAYLARSGSAAAPQALQRLDVDTSGIVLFSLAGETQPAFDALVAEGRLTKRYFALVEGMPPEPGPDGWHRVDAPIARDRHDARRMRVGRTGKPAATLVRAVGRQGPRALVEAELITGRRHQIRVHLAHLGCPIVGDRLYGRAREGERLHLHAHEVRLVHPLTGARLVIESPCPWR